jgi:hypothetical protein
LKHEFPQIQEVKYHQNQLLLEATRMISLLGGDLENSAQLVKEIPQIRIT